MFLYISPSLIVTSGLIAGIIVAVLIAIVITLAIAICYIYKRGMEYISNLTVKLIQTSGLDSKLEPKGAEKLT